MAEVPAIQGRVGPGSGSGIGKRRKRKMSIFRFRPARERESQPVSRVLSRTIMHLGCMSPYTSCGLPGDYAGNIVVPIFGLAPGGVYRAVPVASHAVRSYRTFSPLPGRGKRPGGILSVALSVGSRRPGVTWRPAHVEPGLSSTLTPVSNQTVTAAIARLTRIYCNL